MTDDKERLIKAATCYTSDRRPRDFSCFRDNELHTYKVHMPSQTAFAEGKVALKRPT